MIIKTRKLPPTQTEGARMRATADNGATLTLPYPQGAADPHQLVAEALVMAYSREHRAERIDPAGNRFKSVERES